MTEVSSPTNVFSLQDTQISISKTPSRSIYRVLNGDYVRKYGWRYINDTVDVSFEVEVQL